MSRTLPHASFTVRHKFLVVPSRVQAAPRDSADDFCKRLTQHPALSVRTAEQATLRLHPLRILYLQVPLIIFSISTFIGTVHMCLYWIEVCCPSPPPPRLPATHTQTHTATTTTATTMTTTGCLTFLDNEAIPVGILDPELAHSSINSHAGGYY